MPEKIPGFSNNFVGELSSLSFQEICFEISNKFLSEDILANDINEIIEQSINFDAPLISLENNTHILELFHGPTFAFKDFGARFMAEVFKHFLQDSKKEVIVLVATSGDTGSAVANAFYRKEGLKVVLLYPEKKISNLQEKQLTTLGENIYALEINGTFDDCQSLVKQAFNDNSLKKFKNLTSANSINIARLLPQTFYYFRAFQQLQNKNDELIFSVPSGNLGNLTAGLIAMQMGLPVSIFISATNLNSVFTEFLSTGKFTPRKSVPTLSNAMDVGNPNNFYRIVHLFNQKIEIIKNIIRSKTITDNETIETIRNVYQKYDYLLDPHGAVGFKAAIDLLLNDLSKKQLIILETAHPAKFSETIKESIEKEIDIPPGLKSCLQLEKKSVKMKSVYNELKEYLLAV